MTVVRKLLGFVLRFAAGFVIVLALLVGVVRLVLPEASTLTDEIKAAVKDATGFSLEFSFISAGVSWYGPELRFSGVTLSWPDGEQIIAADRFVMSASLLAALSERALVPSRVLVEGSALEAEVAADGEVFLQGRPWRELLVLEQRDTFPEMRVQLEDIDFAFRDLQRDAPPVDGYMRDFQADLEDAMVEISADMEPGEGLGRRLSVEAELPLSLLISGSEVDAETAWNLAVVLDDFRLDPWLRLLNLPDLPVIGSEGSVEAGVAFTGRSAIEMQVDADLQNVELAQPNGQTSDQQNDQPMVFDRVEGEFNWSLASGGWLASGEGIRISRGSRVWPETNFSLRYVTRPEFGRERYLITSNFLRIDDLLPGARAITPGKLEEAGLAGTARGDLTDLNAEITLVDAQLNDFSIETGFASLGYVSPEQGLELTGYSGELKADNDGGDLTLRTRGARLGLNGIFREALDLTSLQGVAVWRNNKEGYRVLANSIDLDTPHGAVNASVEILTDPEFKNPEVDISGTARLDNVAAAPRYLPKVLPPDVLNWLDSALIAGRVPKASFVLRGALGEFPFENGEGAFLVQFNVVDGVLDYAPGWPILSNIGGELIFENQAFYTTRNVFTLSDIELQKVNLRIDNLRDGLLVAKGVGQLAIPDLVTFLRNSPVRDVLGPVLDDVQSAGVADARIGLVLPIKDLEAWKLDGDFETSDGRFGLAGLEPEFTEFAGKGSIRNTEITVAGAAANLLGEPVTISVRPATPDETDISHLADIAGTMQVRRVWEAFDLPSPEFFGGTTKFSAQALFPIFEEGVEETEQPFRLRVNSDLVGATNAIPYPLLKEAEQIDTLQAEWRFPESDAIDFSGSLQRGFNWVMRLEDDGDGFAIERALVTPAPAPLTLPDEPGVMISGYIDNIVFDDWIDAFSEGEEEIENWEQMFSLIDIQVGEFDLADYRFVDVDLRARSLETAWDVNVTSPWLEGTIILPFEITGPDHMIATMQRVFLIEPLEVADTGEAPTDPRELPTLRGTVEEFAINAQQFGTLKINIDRTPDGLKTVLLQTDKGYFNLQGSADWEVVDSAQRTRLHAELRSKDMKQTLLDLDYDPFLSAKKAKVITDLLWEGPPGMAMIYESTGTVEMMVRDGVVYEVEPGGGRLLGLLSVAAIPRRLTLDFDVMTAAGLPFDKLSGTFQIDFGNAFTCDVGLEGEITDMGLVGRTGMLDEDYDQIAVIRPHVSNLAPVAGAFLAGPAVGVATLLITQIFKKPLSGVGASYYTITGSWDDPQIEPSKREDLDLAAFAECEADLPEMSPEEIKALEGLLQEREPEAGILPEAMFDVGAPPGPSEVNPLEDDDSSDF